MDNKFEPLSPESVVKRFDDWLIWTNPIYKTQDLYEQIEQRLGMNEHNREMWTQDGIDCEVLTLGANSWQKGKVRVKVMVEFCPDDGSMKQPHD